MAFKMSGNRLSRIEIERSITDQIESIAGHLDLEGFAYFKVTRTGRSECFASDVTMEVLKKDGVTYTDMAPFWNHPACEKEWGKK